MQSEKQANLLAPACAGSLRRSTESYFPLPRGKHLVPKFWSLGRGQHQSLWFEGSDVLGEGGALCKDYFQRVWPNPLVEKDVYVRLWSTQSSWLRSSPRSLWEWLESLGGASGTLPGGAQGREGAQPSVPVCGAHPGLGPKGPGATAQAEDQGPTQSCKVKICRDFILLKGISPKGGCYLVY